MSMKNPLTPPGIKPATFRFVAQHLNRCATARIAFKYFINLIVSTYYIILHKLDNKIFMLMTHGANMKIIPFRIQSYFASPPLDA